MDPDLDAKAFVKRQTRKCRETDLSMTNILWDV